MEIKFNNEVTDSVGETIKERLNTSIYGLFIIFWSVLHWKFLITLFFVSEDKIWKAYHILKTDYLNSLLWGSVWWWSVFLWLTPIFLTYFAIRWFPTWFLIDAFRLDEKYRTEKTIIKIKEKKRIIEEEEGLQKAETSKLKAVKEKVKEEKSIEIIDPTISWPEEYNAFKTSIFYSQFNLITESVYKRNGSIVVEGELGGIIFEMPENLLAYCDTNGLIELSINGKIKLTEKGKFFVKQFSLEKGLKIIDARYGKNNKYTNITNELNYLISEDKLKVVIDNKIAGDPLKGVNKEAVIKYQYNGVVTDVIIPEYQTLELP